MMRFKPSRLTVWLLERLALDNEPLVGDLLEESRARPSRVWLWREVLYAALTRARHVKPDVRPLRIVDVRPPVTTKTRVADSRGPAKRVDLSGGPVPGVGGLSVVALASLLTVVSPQMWWLAICCGLVGFSMGVALAILRRREGLRVAGNRLLVASP